MRTLAIIILALAFFPQQPEAQEESNLVAIICGKIYTVSGPPMDRGVILVENGFIVDVLPGSAVPEGAKVVDASSQVVLPGVIDASMYLAGKGADPRSIAPEIRAADGIDYFQNHWALLSGGVTTAYVAPGTRRLLVGQGVVMQLAGSKRILTETYGLHVIVGDSVKNPPNLFTPPIPPSAENPILPAKRQYPRTRMGEFAELRRIFSEVREGKGAHSEERVPFQEVLSGREPLFITALSADDIVKAVLFCVQQKIRPVLVDAVEAWKVADFLSEQNVPVILQAPVSPRTVYRTDEERAEFEALPNAEAASILADAGVSFALDTSSDADSRDLLFVAASSVRMGLSQERALRSITLTPAEILGVDDLLGSIEKGKAADLVFLKEDPFHAAAQVDRVMVRGNFVFERKASDDRTEVYLEDRSLLKGKDRMAIRGGTTYSLTEGVIEDGLILIENGKVVYVGKGRSIPEGSKVIDASGDVVIPGMIDMSSYLGFHLDQDRESLVNSRSQSRSVPSQLTLPPSRFVQLRDEAYKNIVSSGVTSLLLSPSREGPCSLLKVSENGVRVVREVGAYKFSISGGTAQRNSMRNRLKAALRYHQQWEAWERAQKEKKKSPAKTKVVVPKKGDPISGTWKGTLVLKKYGIKAQFHVDLRHEKGRVTGELSVSMRGQTSRVPISGTYQNKVLSISGSQQGQEYQITMNLVGPDHMQGTWKVKFQGQEMNGPVECRREGGKASPSSPSGASPAKGGSEKKPKKDDRFESYRPLFRKEIPAIVRVGDYPSIENAAKVFREEFGLPVVLVGSQETIHTSRLLFDKRISVALGVNFLSEEEGASINVLGGLSSRGIQVAFYSSATTGTKLLPFTAAFAVRHGMDSFDALKALTLNPARMLEVGNELGSIERGKAADLVILSGNLFDLKSRVKTVIADGKIVYERK